MAHSLRLLCLPVVVAVLVTSCGHSSSTDGRLRIVAGESPWGAIAAAIGGSKVSVVSLVADPNTDPHSFSARATDAALVNEASVVIENGLGYDPYVGQLLSTGSTGPRSVVNVADVVNVHGSLANPHLWYWLDRVPRVAAAIEGAMAKRAPSAASYFESNLHRFDAKEAVLVQELNHIKLVDQGARVAETERVAGYLLQEAGLSVVSPLGFALAVENGTAPSFGDQTTMVNLVTSHRVKALIYNVQTVDAVTSQLRLTADKHRVPVVGVSEVIEPQGASFIAWQQRQITDLETALGIAS